MTSCWSGPGCPASRVTSATVAPPRAVGLRDGVGDDKRVVVPCQRALLDLHAAAAVRCDPVDDVPGCGSAEGVARGRDLYGQRRTGHRTHQHGGDVRLQVVRPAPDDDLVLTSVAGEAVERHRVGEPAAEDGIKRRETPRLDVVRCDVPATRAEIPATVPPAHPDAGPPSPEAGSDAFSLLVGVPLDVPAMRRQHDQTALGAVVPQAFNELT